MPKLEFSAAVVVHTSPESAFDYFADYRHVAERSDRLVVLQKGRVALAGPSRAILEGGELASLLGV